jgi:mannose/fructose-specific phosphotransferase system component IIA
MNSGLRGVIVCHAALAAALIEAVHTITGLGDALVPVSNEGCDRNLLRDRIAEALGPDPAVVFVDLPTGSCMMAALSELREAHEASIVTGVNLPMLLEFVFHRDGTAEAAAGLARAAGTEAIRVS